MRVIGVDPGSKSGAYALIAGGAVIVDDLPITRDGVNSAEFARILKVLKPDVAVVERVNAFPGQGVSSVWSFGKAYGCILGVFGAMEIPVELYTPTSWKGAYHLPAKDKEAARAMAIRLFPMARGLEHKKDHGRAEALLIAKHHITMIGKK